MNKLCYTLMLWCLLPEPASAEIELVASIKPLALIGQTILGDQASITTLVDSQQSPHDYAMKPSDRIAIQRAQLLLWVDPHFETYLEDVFHDQAKTKSVITFSSLPGMELIHEPNGELDPHLWLNSRNGIRLAREIAQQASALDPKNTLIITANLQKFEEDIRSIQTELRSLFAMTPTGSYVVFHNAYRYFENEFELEPGNALLRNPELQPSVQEIIRARTYVQELQPVCLFVEPNSNQAIIDTMLGGYSISQKILDILGNDISPNGNGYEKLLRNIGNQFNDCVR